MKIGFVIFLLLIMGAFLIAPAGASATLSFRDMSLTGYQNFRIYEVNGSGTFNRGLFNSSTDAIDLAPDGNLSYVYVLQFVPSTTDYFSNPLMAVESFSDYANSHYPALIFIVFIFALCALVVYLARRK